MPLNHREAIMAVDTGHKPLIVTDLTPRVVIELELAVLRYRAGRMSNVVRNDVTGIKHSPYARHHQQINTLLDYWERAS